ncbi:MAG: glutamine--fructose-6-phosphate transaminase (isomerizing) [Gemmatimonadetes bacterium]|uniref:Glutamine--fructose-6-phosphate aminotransferase [isomerizing] n=1 Tax=Candidatus Kutchimonas denitrificans TaxID=3056748 RepID=A0AAE4Z975_9BACT|nr:glutamine--fructose-6-phosphate transaminase (isomerizing) [Gemmatimonadota bacterium]NIR75604.1 glutamine--fructose-6-phosphate transaminase (isomerizing) [Candidatus Kutchimonas denitrificans]NIS01918.1 glutamine--fructose-6-phosphate transaminase (isomerizing) [Gemmatimonadota bacterium]NIT67699.1 glutamine--fructose-6-phosphate transaminase (isomerizing) [Gemmatimonadota bacterium]NIU53573.1 glutamine--fructose-6-phosphate transaminase (isomerizing) [Gemmatimonadota bacterium]
MCGIVGYIGPSEAAPLLLEGLRRLEYRGYDSAGISVCSNGAIDTRKMPGKIADLTQAIGGDLPRGTTGIAHTRWATHGAPNQINAHPHHDCSGDFAVAHNGIIENAGVLRRKLEELGHTLQSETDTEVLAHLIEEAYDDNLEEAVAAALRQVDGTYGIAVVSTRDPEKLVAARNGSPLLLGIGEGNTYFVASDAAAVIEHTRDVVYLDDGDLAVVTRDGFRTVDLRGVPLTKEVSRVSWDLGTIERGGFPHYMLKEIFEQPDSVRDTMRGRLLAEEGSARLGGLSSCLPWQEIEHYNRIVLTACGTSWHAALIGEYMLEEFARIPVETEYASEFRYRDPVLDDRSLVIAISQSGETADTLAAIREARDKGARVASIVNVVGSTIARESDCGVYIHAGPEIGVASTKAFTSQVVALALVTLYLTTGAEETRDEARKVVKALSRLPDQIAQILERNDELRAMAGLYHLNRNFLYLGRGYNFPVALEGALKLKEISYIHAEGYPAAEMKHGPIALIDENMPVVVIAPRGRVYQKILSNIEEVKARGGRVIAITTDGNGELDRLADHIVTVPTTHEMLQPVLTVIPLQLLAYHIAVLRGCNVDQPRNLAKSVTVE